MVTKGYQKGVYERVTKGIRAEPHGYGSSTNALCGGDGELCSLPAALSKGGTEVALPGIIFWGVSGRGLKPAPLQNLVPRPTEETKEHDMD